VYLLANLYSEYRGNNLQALTKMVITYKLIEIRSYNFCHCTHHEQGNRLLNKFFLYSFFSLVKFMKKNWLLTIVSTWHKQVLITYELLGLMQWNKGFQTALEQENKMMPRFLLLSPSFTKKEMFKKFTEFFNNTHLCNQCIQCFILQI